MASVVVVVVVRMVVDISMVGVDWLRLGYVGLVSGSWVVASVLDVVVVVGCRDVVEILLA